VFIGELVSMARSSSSKVSWCKLVLIWGYTEQELRFCINEFVESKK